jgi:hypothetical protein
MSEDERPPDAPEDEPDEAALFSSLAPTHTVVITGVRGREVDLQFPDGTQYTTTLRKRRRPAGAQRLPPAGRLKQQTFEEAKTLAAGLADGPKQRHWEPLEGEAGLMHRVDKKSPLMTVVRGGPLLDWLGLPATVEGVREELRRAGLPAVLLMHVLIGSSLELAEHNRVYVTVALDDLITDIGWTPRSAAERDGMRRRLWRWVALFDASEVIGTRPGTYTDPDTKEKLDMSSRDALLRVLGRRHSAQLAFDDSAPPLEITYVAGPWIERFRGNRQVLTYFNVDVRRLAAIPAGKPSGAWAQAIGLALHQEWRERVTHQRRTAFTRRQLLDLFPPEPSLDDILKSDKPNRARTYWREAVGLLKQERLIGYYREIGTASEKRQGWQHDWADAQQLDVRPPEEARAALAEVAAAAEAVKAKRGRARSPRRAASAV